MGEAMERARFSCPGCWAVTLPAIFTTTPTLAASAAARSSQSNSPVVMSMRKRGTRFRRCAMVRCLRKRITKGDNRNHRERIDRTTFMIGIPECFMTNTINFPRSPPWETRADTRAVKPL
jgi:hypothetical protein